MNTPRITRPKFPPGYADQPKSEVPWSFVVQRLTESKNYWFCSVRPDGRPHVVPRWAVYMDGKIYYDGSPETRHARNIAVNPHVSVHLESGTEAVILEGACRPAGKPDPELAQRLSAVYKAKYGSEGYAPKPNQWDEGGLYLFVPRQCLAWTVFFENPTKFVFEEKEE